MKKFQVVIKSILDSQNITSDEREELEDLVIDYPVYQQKYDNSDIIDSMSSRALGIVVLDRIFEKYYPDANPNMSPSMKARMLAHKPVVKKRTRGTRDQLNSTVLAINDKKLASCKTKKVLGSFKLVVDDSQLIYSKMLIKLPSKLFVNLINENQYGIVELLSTKNKRVYVRVGDVVQTDDDIIVITSRIHEMLGLVDKVMVKTCVDESMKEIYGIDVSVYNHNNDLDIRKLLELQFQKGQFPAISRGMTILFKNELVVLVKRLVDEDDAEIFAGTFPVFGERTVKISIDYPEEMFIDKKCSICLSNKNIKKCANCKNTLYCSKRCQSIGWDLYGHSLVCDMLCIEGKRDRYEEPYYDEGKKMHKQAFEIKLSLQEQLENPVFLKRLVNSFDQTLIYNIIPQRKTSFFATLDSNNMFWFFVYKKYVNPKAQYNGRRSYKNFR